MQTQNLTNGTNVRFNLPTNDGQTGLLQIDGVDELFTLTEGTGFTMGSKTLTAEAGGISFTALLQIGQMGRWTSERFESLNPIEVIVKEITTKF